jgi:transcriptional regulator with XRE-family HTH domain
MDHLSLIDRIQGVFPLADDLGKTIRILREAKGFSMSEMARRSGVSTPFVSLVEKGEREPSITVLRRMAKSLELPSEALLEIVMGTGGTSKEKGTVAITKAVHQLMEVERKLRTLLTKSGAGDATD